MRGGWTNSPWGLGNELLAAGCVFAGGLLCVRYMLHVAPCPKNQSSVYVYWLCIIDTTPRAHSLPLASPSASAYVRCCCAVCAALAAASALCLCLLQLP